VFVSDSHAGTLLDIDRPTLVAVVHDLPFIADGLYGTFTGTLLTLRAEVLKAKVDGLVRYQRKVGGDDSCLETGT
jgi:hypothetical protein